MEDVINYEEALLSGIIPLDSASGRVNQSFRNIDFMAMRVPLKLFSISGQILSGLAFECRKSGAPLSEDILIDSLQRTKITPEDLVKTQMLFDRCRRAEITEGKFRYVVGIFLKQKEEDLYKVRLGEAYTILTDGLKVGRDVLKGVQASKEYITRGLYNLDQTFMSDVPHGNVREDGKEIWNEYIERRDNPKTFEGVKTGFSVVDMLTNGAIKGEFWVIAGYAGQGKSNTLVNIIYNAAVNQGLNVVVAVNEMIYRQYRIRMFIRHSRNAIFGLPNGIPYSKFKLGKMNAVEEQSFQDVIGDFEKNPKYGRVEVCQIPKGYGIDFLASRLSAYQSMFNIDLVCLDYLQLFGKAAQHQSKREYLDGLIVDAKQLAISFNRGEGVPIITPWQINRTSFKEACQTGVYTLSCFAESPEAERSADMAMWILRRDEEMAKSEIRAGVMKYRDGVTDSGFTLFEDFSTYYAGDVKGVDTKPDSGAAGLY